MWMENRECPLCGTRTREDVCPVCECDIGRVLYRARFRLLRRIALFVWAASSYVAYDNVEDVSFVIPAIAVTLLSVGVYFHTSGFLRKRCKR